MYSIQPLEFVTLHLLLPQLQRSSQADGEGDGDAEQNLHDLAQFFSNNFLFVPRHPP